MTTTTTAVRTPVVDNPAYAWRNVHERVKNAFYARLDADFVHDNRTALDTAATVLFGPILITVWAEHGYQVCFGPDGDTMLRRPKGFPWHKVWDEAAARLDPHTVVLKARLDDELLRYAAAHPRTEQLEQHCKALRHRSAPLRAELHDRLDALAENTDSLRAEQQIDGWRALVDTAVTCAQLDKLAADIPA